ncbi:MAG: YncE family protein [Rhodospirillaceae bacterium]|nr:YncE family protein [Rhodospirillaceae bacterium]
MRVSGMGMAFEGMYRPIAIVSVLLLAACGGDGEAPAASSLDLTDIDAVVERGEDLYLGVGECWDCHGASGEGTDTAPAINHAPSAFDIHYMLNTNPEMADVSERLQATREDIIAIAAYTRSFAGLEVTAGAMDELVASMASARDYSEYATTDAFVVTARDLVVGEVERFDTVIADWERRSREGSIRSDYTIRVARTYDPGEPKFEPEPGTVYFYENTGAGQPAQLGFPNMGRYDAGSVQIVVGDAATKEIVAYHTFPPEFRASVHSTAVTPDGRYVYITGPRPSYADAPDRPVGGLDSPATIIKADALTLQPVEQLIVGGRMHHAQIFQDRLMLVDTFARDEDGLDVFLMDPDTQEVIGGVRDEDLGGVSYTSFTDNEYIYILMQPAGYGSSSISGYLVTGRYNRGEFAVLRPFWVAKVDPESWEVVQEYPYPGFRANWIVIDSARENMYVPVGGNSYLNKIDLVTGEIVWTAPTGTGPYGASLTADESQIWVADKGETTGMFGRTMTVIDTERGRQLETVFSGYQVDHVVLSPNGREIWGTSNSDGKIYVFDVETREQTHVIDMPGFGDAHGLVFVWYDDAGEPHVVRDQGGFHSGINPALGNVLEY